MSLNGGNIGLGYVLTAQDLASSVVRNIERSFARLDQTVGQASTGMAHAFSKVGTAAALLTASVAPIGIAFASAVHAGNFVQGLAAVGAATNATADEMARLRLAALQAGVATQFSPTDVTDGLISLATAGQTATQAIDTLRPTLNLAAASLGQLNVSQAAEAIVGTLNSYAWGAERAAEVTDKLVAVGNLTNFQARDLSVGLSRAAEAGALFGQSFDDILVGMGLLRNRNIAADVASTALRNALIRVNSDLRSQGILMQAGVPLRDQYTGQLRSILDVMSDFAAVSRHLDPLTLHPMVKNIFGEEAMPAFSAVANATFTSIGKGTAVTHQGAQAIGALRRALQQAGGAAEQFVRRYNDNFAGSMTLLRGTLQTWAIAVGEVFGDVLKPCVVAFTRVLNSMLEGFISLPRPVKHFLAVTALAAMAVLALGGIIQGVTLLCSVLSAAFAAAIAPLSGAIAAIGTIAAPLGLALVALGAFAAAYRTRMQQIGKTNQQSKGHFTTFWGGLSQLMKSGALKGDILARLNASAWLKSLVVGAYKVGVAFASAWDGVKKGFADTVSFLGPVFDALSASLTATGNGLAHYGNQLGQLGRWMAPALSVVLKSVGWLVGGLLATVGAGVSALLYALSWAPRLLVGTVDAIATILTSGVLAVMRMGPAVMAAVKSLSEALAAWASRVKNLLPSAFQHAKDRVLTIVRSLGLALERCFAGIRRIVAKPFKLLPHGLTQPVVTGPEARAVPTRDTQSLVAPAGAARQAWSTKSLAAVAELQGRSSRPVATQREASQRESGPINVEVKLDGEAIARATARAKREMAARRFQPLMGY